MRYDIIIIIIHYSEIHHIYKKKCSVMKGTENKTSARIFYHDRLHVM